MRTLLTILICIYGLLEAGGVVWEEDNLSFPIAVSISEEQVDVGDTIIASVTVTPPEGYRLDTAALKERLLTDNLFGPSPFSLVDEQVEENDRDTTAHFVIDTHLPGNYFLSFRDVSLVAAEGTTLTQVTPAFPISIAAQVSGIPDVDSNLYGALPLTIDIPPGLSPHNIQQYITGDRARSREANRNVAIMRSRTFPFFYSAIAAATGIIAWGVLLLQRFYAKQSETRQQRRYLEKRAYGELARLKQQLFAEEEDYDRGYTQLTDLVREMVEEVWHLDAPKLTTPEFLAQAAVAPDLKATLKTFLEAADKVKFARAAPPQQQWNDALAAAHALLDILFYEEKN